MANLLALPAWFNPWGWTAIAVVAIIILIIIIVLIARSGKKQKREKETDAEVPETAPVRNESVKGESAVGQKASVNADAVEREDVADAEEPVAAAELVKSKGEPVREPEKKAEPKPVQNVTKGESKPLQKAETKSAPKTEPKPKAAAKPAQKSAPKNETKSAPKSETKPKPAQKAEPKSKAAANSAAKGAPAKSATVKAAESVKTYHIAKRKEDGRWQVKAAGASKAIKLFLTQSEAIDFAKKTAENQDARIVIHKEDGTFRRLNYTKK